MLDIIERILNGEVTVNCKSENEANNYLNWLHQKGYSWSSGCDLTTKNYYGSYGKNTGYWIHKNTKKKLGFSNVSFYEDYMDLESIQYSDIISWEI